MSTNVLETIDPRKLGNSLQTARKKCGMTQVEAAQVIGAARTTLVAIEKGDRRLKPNELIKLARAYGKAVSDFVRSNNVADIAEPFEVQFRAAYQRKPEEEDKITPAIHQFEELCHNYLELEQMMSAPMPRNYPAEYDINRMPIEAAAESTAISERQRLGLGDGPIPSLRDVLEINVGVRIFYIKLPPKYSEIYSYSEQLGGCMAINIDHPEERRRWSMAHGYLHFLAHRRKSVIDFDGQYQRMPISEQLAETFPKYFLMPTSGLLRRFSDLSRDGNKFTTTNLFTLAHYYGVSVAALTYRLEEMKLVPSGLWERLQDRGLKVKQVQQQLELQEIKQRADSFPIHYQNLAIGALDEGLITEGKFADLLGVDRLEARRIALELREQSGEVSEEIAQMDLQQA
jgi:Zn-dependent peptidase ImmA (M78 family)/DNA-binding XRE family transcriptional regulator